MRPRVIVTIVLAIVFVVGRPAVAIPPVPDDHCVEQDDNGTVRLPARCRLASPTAEPALLQLATGDVLEARFYVDSFFDITYSIDPGTGDETATYQGRLTMLLEGQGGLDGYERRLTMPVQMQSLHGAHTAGAPVQSFPTEMISMQAELFGDPDFDQLRVTAGSAFGLPSPGQTTLTQLPRGDFNVDSFFDIVYRIEFQGSPGGPLAGQGGNRTYSLEVRVNRIEMAVAAPNPGGSADIPADAPLAPPPGDAMEVTAGLPPDSSFHVRPRASSVSLVSTGTGSLGGPSYESAAAFQVRVVGEGGLAGLSRTFVFDHLLEVHAAPIDPSADVQEIDTEMVSLQGELFGDPDFDLLRLTAGSDFGLPSPGHTTLTRLPSGNFNVDSFFDIEYRIEYVGAPGGALDGLSGTQTASLRLEQGGRLPRLELHPHGLSVHPVGGVRLDEPLVGEGRHLVVSNIGSSGKDGVDGVEMDLGDGGPLGVELRLDMGPAGALAPGASCRLELVTRDASSGQVCAPCTTLTLFGLPDGQLQVGVDPPDSHLSSSRRLHVRDAGGSVDLRALSPGTGSTVATGPLGTTPDGTLRVRVEHEPSLDPGGGGGGGRIAVRVTSPTPAPIRLEGAALPEIGDEVLVAFDGLPPGEPVRVELRCGGLSQITIPIVELISPAARRGFDPDPDNNCTIPIEPPKLSSSTSPGGGGQPLPYLELTELGPVDTGLVVTADLDRDGALDRALVGEIQFTAGPDHRLPADSSLRLDVSSDACGPGTGCGLGLALERVASGEPRGGLFVAGFTPRELTVVARSGGADVDAVTHPLPFPPTLFTGELLGLPDDPLRFDIAVNFEDVFCSCDVACECVAMHLVAPQPSPIALTGSPIGPVSADELELRLSLEPQADGVQTEMLSMSLHGTNLCEARVYSTRFDPLVLDLDGDGIAGARSGGSDCDDTDSSFWSPPGEVRDLRVDRTHVRWSPPVDAGGLPQLVLYDTLVSTDASDFGTAECIESNDGDDTEAEFLTLPDITNACYKLTRAANGCPTKGTLGSGGGSGGSIWIRTGPVCP